MRISKTWIGFALGVVLWACSPDPENRNDNYLRKPGFFKADTTFSNHPFCDDSHPFNTKDECLAAKKYQLTWSRPEDTVKLLGYRIYLDTLHNPKAPPGRNWEYVRDRPELASILVESRAGKDTVVFVFSDQESELDTLRQGERKIILVDSSLRSESNTGKLVFGLVAVYSGGVIPGLPLYAYFKTTDKDPPDPFNPRIRPMAKQVAVEWQRPTDRTSFFDPSQDTGLISEYRLWVNLVGRDLDNDRKRAFRPKLISYFVGDRDMSAGVTDSVDNDSIPEFILFRLPDSNRSAKRTTPMLADSLHLLIGNLLPRDSLRLWLYAIDSNGNQNTTMPKVTILMTDTTQPSKPSLDVDSVTRNGFQVAWSASRDSLQDGESRTIGPHPNFQIQKYLLSRILTRLPGEKTTGFDRFDTSITPAPGDSVKERFVIPMKFLPPGSSFHLRLTAIDMTGFESATDTLTVATDSIRFVAEDSALTCPAGFIPIPRGEFKLGDEGPVADADEKFPDGRGRIVKMESFCIEPYEHRDSTLRRFVSNVTFDQARKACEEMDPAFGTQLCSEAEWERSCEGSWPDSLLHGIQSENKNPNILQTFCNQSTNDSAMAMSFEFRNSVCLTTEGVYDMAGNLSEWVRDPYVAGAYAGVDSVLDHDFTFADSGNAQRRGTRGGNYLKTGLSLAATQRLARCSNRDFAQQVRPLFREDCKDADKPKIAIIYAPGLAGHRCMDVPPEGIDLAQVSDIIPSPRDSTRLLIFLKGIPAPKDLVIQLPDTVFAGKRPISAQLTTRSLASVNFVKAGGDSIVPDTLDAAEMRESSQATLAKIFRREAGSSEWSVEKDDDGNFKIQFLYAYTVMGSKPAKEFYSNRAIGFRCCSKAKAPAAEASVTSR